MANWGNTKISKEEDIKVISHERIRDTNPETYRTRGLFHLINKEYKAAEEAYLEAMRFAGKNDSDLRQLFVVYYKSKNKAMEAKADRMFNDWWWRQGENKILFYFILCLSTFFLAAFGMTGNLLIGVFIIAAFGGMIFLVYPPNKVFAANVRWDLGFWFGRFLIAMVPFLIFIFAIILLVTTDIGKATNQFIWTEEALFIVHLISKIIGIAFGIVFLYSFHKGISVMQDGVRQWKTASLRKFFGRILTIVRIAGTIAMLVVSYLALFHGWTPF